MTVDPLWLVGALGYAFAVGAVASALAVSAHYRRRDRRALARRLDINPEEAWRVRPGRPDYLRRVAAGRWRQVSDEPEYFIPHHGVSRKRALELAAWAEAELRRATTRLDIKNGYACPEPGCGLRYRHQHGEVWWPPEGQPWPPSAPNG